MKVISPRAIPYDATLQLDSESSSNPPRKGTKNEDVDEVLNRGKSDQQSYHIHAYEYGRT